MMKVCIITPVYNGSSLILETIQSILNQQNLEKIALTYIICDGNSDDGTIELIEKQKSSFQEKNISFKVISEPDNGMYDALAKGFKLAGYDHDIYAYINAGDYYAPYALNEVTKLFKQRNINWLTGLRAKYNSQGVLIETRFPMGYSRKLIRQGFFGSYLPYIQQESTFWSADLHKSLCLIDLASFKYAGDFYLWSTFSNHADLWVVNAWLSGFRLHPGQLSERFVNEYKEEFSKIAAPKTILSWGKAIVILFLLKLPLGLRQKLSRNTIKL